MNSVYLLFVYKNFAQVERLIERLLECNAGIIVHVDRRATIPSNFHGKYPKQRVFLTTSRYDSKWGSFESVLAILLLIEEGLRRFPETRYMSLLSGQDYPIKNPGHLDNFFETAELDYIKCGPLQDEQWQYGGSRRVNKFYWAKNRKSILGFIFRTIPLPPRRFPIPLEKLISGSTWWSIRTQTAARLIDFIRTHPKILAAFRWTYIPEELVIPTILQSFLQETALAGDHLRVIEHFSLPRDYLRLKILNRNGIKDLGLGDIERLKSSPALFARKFDMVKEPGILDALDQF